MIKALIQRLIWLLGPHSHPCPVKGCGRLATHTWWGYQDDDLRDIDVCFWHRNSKKEVMRKQGEDG